MLLHDVFGREDLLAGLPRIRRRVVAWGRDFRPRTLPHSSVVISEQELLDRIHQGLEQNNCPPTERPDWTILASTPLPPSSLEHHFGSRMATASPAKLKPQCDSESCWIESLENGWLFLLPIGNGVGWLLSVGDSVESLLGTSRLIEQQIAKLGQSHGTFPSHPRISWPLSEPGWLACGTAAVGFDPLCGEGTGNAIREAILAAAVVRAATEGADVANLVAQYRARLLAGFQTHVALCLEFYMSGRSGGWWEDQVNELKRGLAWCSRQSADTGTFRDRLNGSRLEAAS